MEPNSVRKADRTFSWIAAALLGLPGLFDAITGTIEANVGKAMYGLGKAMCGVFFLLHALAAGKPQPRSAGVIAGSLLFAGLAIGVLGFLIKKGIV